MFPTSSTNKLVAVRISLLAQDAFESVEIVTKLRGATDWANLSV